MIPMQRQAEILNELSQILHDEADKGYSNTFCEYTFMPEYDTIKSRFNFHKDGERINRALSTGLPSRNRDLVQELRTLMKEHTGGEWTSFTLTLDADGQANTKFVYPES